MGNWPESAGKNTLVAATLEETSAKTSLVISRFVYSIMLIEENLVSSVVVN
jgi:hypothetical protein